MLEVVEGAGRLLRGSCLLGCHLIPHLPLYLLLALLAGLNAVEPERVQWLIQQGCATDLSCVYVGMKGVKHAATHASDYAILLCLIAAKVVLHDLWIGVQYCMH